jgi:GTP-binding protein HflX
VLKQLDADRVPQIRVYNKIDKLDRVPRVANNQRGQGRAVWLSAATGDGLPMLLQAIEGRVLGETMHRVIRLQPTQGRQRAKLFEIGAVLNEEVSEDGSWTIELKMAERDLLRFLKHENLAAELLEPSSVQAPAAATTLE